MIRPSPELIQIAPGDARDLCDVMVTMRAAFDPAFGEAWTEAQCSGIMSMPGTWLLLARDEAGGVAGFALARAIAGEGELLLLAVRPGSRRAGIGNRLLDQVIEDARGRGVQTLHLEVRATNSAIGLYAAAGFDQVGRRPDYYRGQDGASYDALTYSRDISNGR